MYVAYGLMQIADVHSTVRGIHAGGREANKVLAPIAHRPALLVPVKAAAFVGTVYLVERLRKTNRVAAVALMIGLNSAYAVIVAHNYRLDFRSASR